MKQPILMFKGSRDVCYGIMRSFSDRLCGALESLGEEVIYLDTADDFITEYTDRSYKAIIAVMDTVFDNYMPGTDVPLFDFYKGPKFNYWPDHPSVFYGQMEKTPKDYHILTQDMNYVDFINRYYSKADAFFLPPGGKEVDAIIPFEEREYDVCFVGTYKNWKGLLENLVFKDEIGIKLRDSYLNILITQPELTTEDGFWAALGEVGINPDDQEYLYLLNMMHWLADGVVSALFRERLIENILNEEICIDVFGDSWYSSPFSDNPNLRIHPEVDSDDISGIYSNSRISINMMSWHKNCITERILDAMCAGSIVITDRTDVVEKAFISGEDILCYSLTDLEAVPEMVRDHINDQKMAQKGQKKALEDHLWTNRARELLQIIEKIEKEKGSDLYGKADSNNNCK